MSISPRDAEQALAAMATADQDSRARRIYRKGAPYIIGWGIAWSIGFVGSARLSVGYATDLWLALILTMTGITALLIRKQSAGRVRWGTIMLYCVTPSAALIILVNLIADNLHINDPANISALFVMVVAAAYVISGLKFGSRYVLLGVGLAVITGLGIVFLPAPMKFIALFLDAAWLLMGGFWFRSA